MKTQSLKRELLLIALTFIVAACVSVGVFRVFDKEPDPEQVNGVVVHMAHDMYLDRFEIVVVRLGLPACLLRVTPTQYANINLGDTVLFHRAYPMPCNPKRVVYSKVSNP